MAEVRDRAWCAITGLLAAHPEGAVVTISHNFTIASIVSTVLEMPLRHFRRLKQGLGSITRLDLSYNGRGTLVSLNETWHLERVSAARNDPIRE